MIVESPNGIEQEKNRHRYHTKVNSEVQKKHNVHSEMQEVNHVILSDPNRMSEV